MCSISLLILFVVLQTGLCNQPETLQIIETKAGPNGTRVIHYKGGSVIRDILTADDVKDLPILVYSVTGKTRGGKSFLLNLMYKYLNTSGNADWKNGQVPKVFDFIDGIDSWTKGLWLCTRIFKRTLKNGTEVGIMLMDSQGLFDGEVTGGESVAMSGVSTILSHVQMFNMKEKITTNDLEQIMLHLVPENVEDNSTDHRSISSSLMFVVRDFIGKRKYGLGLSNGKIYIDDEQKRGTPEYQSMWAQQRGVFNSIDCVLLPYPGSAVMTEEFTDSPNLQVLKSEFVSEIHMFLKELFAIKNLTPHPGGMTGRKMHDILTNVDGKEADISLSYYNMYTSRTNQLVMEESVEQFKQTLTSSGNLYKANEYMNDTLTTTQFKGLSASEFTTNLRKALERIVNSKVTYYSVGTYKLAAIGDTIRESHITTWPKVVRDLKLLVGSKQDVDENKNNILKEIATFYYAKLAQEEETKFKNWCETSDCEIFYDRMLALNHSESLNVLLETSIKTCEDFKTVGANLFMLSDICQIQRFKFGATVKKNLLRNMYKVNEYFVQRYSKLMNKRNVKAHNFLLWPKLKKDISNLEFESESEKSTYTRSITKEISSVYYKLLREEVLENLKIKWSILSDSDFLQKYETYMEDESNLKDMILDIFPKYIDFKIEGQNDVWEGERKTLEAYVKLEVYHELKSRGYETEAAKFWAKYGPTIVTTLVGIGLVIGVLIG